jgi:hypothetical protein
MTIPPGLGAFLPDDVVHFTIGTADSRRQFRCSSRSLPPYRWWPAGHLPAPAPGRGLSCGRMGAVGVSVLGSASNAVRGSFR